MRALIPEVQRRIAGFFLLTAAAALVSCATHKDPPRLVDDPDERRESSLPWTQQEKWEQAGELSNLTDKR
jgi:hypothetical protein